MRTFEVIRRPHYDANAKMAVPELCYKQLLPFISCDSYSELWQIILTVSIFV